MAMHAEVSIILKFILLKQAMWLLLFSTISYIGFLPHLHYSNIKMTVFWFDLLAFLSCMGYLVIFSKNDYHFIIPVVLE